MGVILDTALIEQPTADQPAGLPPHESPCPRCLAEPPHTIEKQTDGIHYAKVVCCGCSRFLAWLPKPDTEQSRRPAAHRDLVQKYSRGLCEMCGAKKENLPKGQTLEAQHVAEYQHGGGNDRTNIWIVCTGCHKLIHWARTYHGQNQE